MILGSGRSGSGERGKEVVRSGWGRSRSEWCGGPGQWGPARGAGALKGGGTEGGPTGGAPTGPEGWGHRRVGARKVGPKGEAQRGGEGQGVGGQNFALFFFSPATSFALFLSLGVFSWNFGGVHGLTDFGHGQFWAFRG